MKKFTTDHASSAWESTTMRRDWR